MSKQQFKEGDSVYTYGYDGSDNVYGKFYGTIHLNTEYPQVSDWYIKFDDGQEFAVLEIDLVYPDDREVE